MDYYIEIRVVPDPEFSDSVLLNALFAKLHRALVQTGHGGVGVSFPHVQPKSLGDAIRLHGNQDVLQRLMEVGWLKGLTDYTSASGIRTVPDTCRHRVVRRVQAKSSPERLYRRSVRKGWLTAEEATAKINAGKDHHLKLPYLQLKSSSTGQMFRLFIQHGEISNIPVAGTFSAYALSDGATIPWF